MEKNIYNWITAVSQKLTQHCKSTVLQLKSSGVYKFEGK